MLWCILWAVGAAAGWVAALVWRGRAKRYQAAFDRAFVVARRAYSFTDAEAQDFARVFGRSIDKDVGKRPNEEDLGAR